jgi:PPE-repeat protein
MASFEDGAAYPPELNFYQLTAGDMAASAAAAMLAQQALSAAMSAELATLGVNTSSTATIGWEGPGGVAMTLSATQMMDVFGMAIAWLEEGSAATAQIVEAHQTAAQTMIPGPVCDENRATYGGLALTNFMGINFPPMGALDASYFGEFWPHNATALSVYQAVVTAAMAILSTPPPMSPTAADPAGALAGVAQAAAQTAGQSALQTSAQTMSTTAEAPAAASQGAGGSMSSAMGSMSSMMSMPMQMMSSLPQMLAQAPQMLGQVMQSGMGLLGPLTSSLGSGAGGDAALASSIAPGGAGGIGAAGLGGGGGGGLGSGFGGAGPVASSFTRPASSFNTPSAPKLPGGWGGGPEAPGPVASSGTSAMGGGGGMYGAPGAAGMARDDEKGAQKAPARKMQLTGRTGREE